MTERRHRPGARRRTLGISTAITGLLGACIAAYGLAARDAGARTCGAVVTMMCVGVAIVLINPPRE